MTDRNRDYCRPLRLHPHRCFRAVDVVISHADLLLPCPEAILWWSRQMSFFPGIPSTLLPQDVALTDCLNPDPNTEKVKKNADFNGTTQNMGKINVEAISFWRATDWQVDDEKWRLKIVFWSCFGCCCWCWRVRKCGRWLAVFHTSSIFPHPDMPLSELACLEYGGRGRGGGGGEEGGGWGGGGGADCRQR